MTNPEKPQDYETCSSLPTTGNISSNRFGSSVAASERDSSGTTISNTNSVITIARTASVSETIRSLLMRSPVSCVNLSSPLELHNSQSKIMNYEFDLFGLSGKRCITNQIYVLEKLTISVKRTDCFRFKSRKGVRSMSLT